MPLFFRSRSAVEPAPSHASQSSWRWSSATRRQVAIRWKWFMGDSPTSTKPNKPSTPFWRSLFLPSLALFILLFPLTLASAYSFCLHLLALRPLLLRLPHLPLISHSLYSPPLHPNTDAALPLWPAAGQILALLLLTDLLFSLLLATLAAAWLDIARLLLRVVVSTDTSPPSPRTGTVADLGSTYQGEGGHWWGIVDAGVRGCLVCRVCGRVWAPTEEKEVTIEAQ